MRETTNSIRKTFIISEKCYQRNLPYTSGSMNYLLSNGITGAGVSILRDKYEIGRVGFGEYILVISLEGEGTLITENGESPLKAGMFFCSMPNTPLIYKIKSDEWKMLWFHLSEATIWQPLKDFAPIIYSNFENSCRLEEVLLGFYDESTSGETFSTRLVRLYSEQIYIYIRRFLLGYINPEENKALSRLRPVWNEVSSKINKKWSVETLALKSGISEAHFNRLCRECYGMPPMQYLTRMRMQRAEEMLRDSALTLNTIACEIGYESEFAFSSAFKRVAGVSPAAYREKQNR